MYRNLGRHSILMVDFLQKADYIFGYGHLTEIAKIYFP